MVLRNSPDWSRRVPRTLIIPKIVKLRTLADVRELMRHVPADRRELPTWRHVAAVLDDAANGGDVQDASVALRMVLQIERVECW
jgi:hypothetical protein